MVGRSRRTCAARPRRPAYDAASRPIQLRHAHAVEMAHEGVPLIVIQRQIGRSNLGMTSIYLQGIDNAESSRRSTPAAHRWCRAHDPATLTRGHEERSSREAIAPVVVQRWSVVPRRWSGPRRMRVSSSEAVNERRSIRGCSPDCPGRIVGPWATRAP
jgi:hypothetical protein